MATPLRSRSESLLMAVGEDLMRPQPGRLDLYSAAAARKKAEQDSLLLANRIRLLRAEEEKTRKRVQDTEAKTREVLELRRRNEERRLSKEAEELRREAEEQELRARAWREREEQQRKLHEKQRAVLEQKISSSTAVKQEREAAKLALQEQRAEKEAEVTARAERVRCSVAASAQSRARSEGAKQELAKSVIRERALFEENQHRARLSDIERMEREEAELVARLQQSQEQHRVAFLRLEDAMQQGGPQGPVGGFHRMSPSSCSSSSTRSTPLMLHSGTPTARGSSSDAAVAALRPVAGSASGPGVASTGARPPRPRAGPHAMLSGLAPGIARARPSSGSRAGARRGEKPSARSASSCSTASGADSSLGGAATSVGGSSMPSTPQGQQITYTTVDGLLLDIPQEEDLDLASLLNG